MEDSEVDAYLMDTIVSFYSGEITEAQTEVLFNWIDQSPENLKYFKSIGDIWYASGLLSSREYSTLKGYDRVIKKIMKEDKDSLNPEGD